MVLSVRKLRTVAKDNVPRPACHLSYLLEVNREWARNTNLLGLVAGGLFGLWRRFFPGLLLPESGRRQKSTLPL